MTHISTKMILCSIASLGLTFSPNHWRASPNWLSSKNPFASFCMGDLKERGRKLLCKISLWVGGLVIIPHKSSKWKSFGPLSDTPKAVSQLQVSWSASPSVSHTELHSCVAKNACMPFSPRLVQPNWLWRYGVWRTSSIQWIAGSESTYFVPRFTP